MSQLYENFATQWASKNQHIPKHQLFWEGAGIFYRADGILPTLFTNGSERESWLREGHRVSVSEHSSAHTRTVLDAERYGSAPHSAGR